MIDRRFLDRSAEGAATLGGEVALDGSPPPRSCSSVSGGIQIAPGAPSVDDLAMAEVAAVFEARMTPEQARALAGLMEAGRATRPMGVETAGLLVDGDLVQLVAFWKDPDTLDRYLSTDVPRGTQLMRQVGAEPKVRIVDVLELG
jgi:hypothetical protein